MSDRTAHSKDCAGPSGNGDTVDAGGGPPLIFRPSMSIQRYDFVAKAIAARPHIRSVVDFGCAGGQLISRLRASSEQLEWIVGVDVDASVLKANASRIQPPTMLYSIAGGRQRPLYVAIFQGSITDYDQRMSVASAATLVEVIEHLDSDVLEAAVVNVFGRLAPELVVVTTPNVEFNSLIPGLQGMRHYDHKFEWTRLEFQTWCHGICEKYLYTVSTHDIGDDPLARGVPVGCCTQAAIFSRQHNVPPAVLSKVEGHEARLATEASLGGVAEDNGGSPCPGSGRMSDVAIVSIGSPPLQQQLPQAATIGRLQPQDHCFEQPTSGDTVTCCTGNPARCAAIAESCPTAMSNDCQRQAEGSFEEAVYDRVHRKCDCDFATCEHPFSNPYCLIAEYTVPARRQQSPATHLANELEYQLRRISRARQEAHNYSYDDEVNLPCYFCANSSSVLDSSVSLNSDYYDGSNNRESSSRPPSECEITAPSTSELEDWDDCAVDAGSPTCLHSDNAAETPFIEEARGCHARVTASDFDDAFRSPERTCGYTARSSPSASLLEQERWSDGDGGLPSSAFVTDNEQSTSAEFDDCDLASACLPTDGLLGSLPGGGDAPVIVADQLVLPQIDDSALCHRWSWPNVLHGAEGSSDDEAQTNDVEECSHCPVHITIRCLMRCPGVRELCDGQPGRVAEAVRGLGYSLTSEQRVVIYKQRVS